MKFGHVKKRATFTERRRDCTKCGHGDKVHVRVVVREEILAIIDIERRAKRKKVFRTRNLKPTPRQSARDNSRKRGQQKCSQQET
jgi:hypothetical protein